MPRSTLITVRPGGEYATTELTDGSVETVWFGDDGTSRVVGRHRPALMADIQARHIADDQG